MNKQKIIVIATAVALLIGIILFVLSSGNNGSSIVHVYDKAILQQKEILRLSDITNKNTDNFDVNTIRSNIDVLYESDLRLLTIERQKISTAEVAPALASSVFDDTAEVRFDEAAKINQLQREFKSTYEELLTAHLETLKKLEANAPIQSTKIVVNLAIENTNNVLEQIRKL